MKILRFVSSFRTFERCRLRAYHLQPAYPPCLFIFSRAYARNCIHQHMMVTNLGKTYTTKSSTDYRSAEENSEAFLQFIASVVLADKVRTTSLQSALSFMHHDELKTHMVESLPQTSLPRIDRPEVPNKISSIPHQSCIFLFHNISALSPCPSSKKRRRRRKLTPTRHNPRNPRARPQPPQSQITRQFEHNKRHRMHQ